MIFKGPTNERQIGSARKNYSPTKKLKFDQKMSSTKIVFFLYKKNRSRVVLTEKDVFDENSETLDI